MTDPARLTSMLASLRLAFLLASANGRPLIVGDALVRYRSGHVRQWLPVLSERHCVVSTRGGRIPLFPDRRMK